MTQLDELTKIAATLIAKHHGQKSKKAISRYEEALRAEVFAKYGRVRLPEPGQTVAVSLTNLKTSALFYDRIWAPENMKGAPPAELTVFGATHIELAPILWDIVVQNVGQDSPLGHEFLAADREPAWLTDIPTSKLISDALYRDHRMQAVPVYETEGDLKDNYQPGKNEIVVAAISGLKLVDEKKLSWKQVIEFREDEDAKRKLRRMRSWLDEACVGKTSQQISDIISVRLEDYDWALKKHGLQTVTGTVHDLLDPRVVSTAAATVAGLAVASSAFWAALGGAGVLVGRAAVSVTQKMIDLADRKRGQGAEVAFVHELQKLKS